MSEHEGILIGGILRAPELWPEVSDIVRAEDFEDMGPRAVFAAMADLVSRGQPLDLIAVLEALRQAGDLEHVGGRATVLHWKAESELGSEAVSAAKAIRRAALCRRVAALLRAAGVELEAEGPEAVIERLPALLAEQVREDASYVTIADAAREHLRRLQEPGACGVPTGLPNLDAVVRGLRPGELWVLAARPRIGKSILATFIGRGLALAGTRCELVSMEMTPSDLGEVALCQASGIHIENLRKRARFEMGDVAEHAIAEHLDGLPFGVHDAPRITVDRLCGLIRSSRLRRGAEVVFVDNLSLLTDPSVGTKTGRTWEIASITAKLKAVARETGCAVVIIVHLNRELERRTDGAPRLSDLRDSGAIEQDADCVLMLSREDLSEDLPDVLTDDPVEVTVHVQKRRGGRPGKAYLLLNPLNLVFTPDVRREEEARAAAQPKPAEKTEPDDSKDSEPPFASTKPITLDELRDRVDRYPGSKVRWIHSGHIEYGVTKAEALSRIMEGVDGRPEIPPPWDTDYDGPAPNEAKANGKSPRRRRSKR